jgi:quercetin dioxygenase-like cupin family protein
VIKNNLSHTVETASAGWKRSKVAGVEYVALNADLDDRYGTFLLKMAPKTKYPKHRHPEGEEILMLKGDMTIGGRTMKGGDFLYSPPGSIHEASTENGCMFLTMLPKPIEMISQATGVEGDMELNTEAAAPPVSQTGPTAFDELDISSLPDLAPTKPEPQE